MLSLLALALPLLSALPAARAQGADAAAAAAAAAADSNSPYWHDRYHGMLSMSVYGDYVTNCPLFFTQAGLQKNFPGSTEAPWTILSQWGPTPTHGITGYNVVVPEMNKTVMVFSGIYGWQNFNATPAPIGDALNTGCGNCTAHAGALQAYLEAKELTNDWQVVKTAEATNGHIWSVTGHGFGGMVAQVAAVDLGYRKYASAVHTFGAPPVFNPAGADLFNSLFEGESNSRTVANNDSVPTMIPQSADYQFVLGGFHVWGTNATYGQNYVECPYSPDDPNCLGGDTESDHYFYYTEYGSCGQNETLDQYNLTAEVDELDSVSSAYYLTATASVSSVSLPSGALPTSTVLSSSSSAASSSPAATSTAASNPGSGAQAEASASAGATSGACRATAVGSALGLLVLLGTMVAL